MQSNYEIIFGWLGRDPDYRKTIQGQSLCYFPLAIKLADVEKPKWIKAVTLGSEADACSIYLKKGKAVFLRGLKIVRRISTKDQPDKEIEEFMVSQVGLIGLL